MQFLLPRKYKKSVKCHRCTKKYSPDYKECPHCSDVKDGRELENFIQQHKSEMRGNSTLGLYFMFAAVLVLLLMSLI